MRLTNAPDRFSAPVAWKTLGIFSVATCKRGDLRCGGAAAVAEAVLRDDGVTLLGAPSLTAALDIDWTDPAAQAEALGRLLADVDRLEQ
jgi:hypothetical protein